MVEWVQEAESVLRSSDRTLAAIMDKCGPCGLRPRSGHYKSLVRAIISQQISTSAARSIRRRLLRAVSNKLSPKRVLELKDEELRAIGLSPQKKGYILDLSRKVHSSEVRIGRYNGQSDEEIISELTKIKGIGRWTAEMFLIFSLNRPNVLPVDDLGVKKGMMLAYGLRKLPSAERMEKISRNWEPYRTLGSWYMWRHLERR